MHWKCTLATLTPIVIATNPGGLYLTEQNVPCVNTAQIAPSIG